MIDQVKHTNREIFEYDSSSVRSASDNEDGEEKISNKIVQNPRRDRRIHSSHHFAYESIRKSTFDTWPANFINTDELAKCGFFYLRMKDLVQCFFCKGVVGYWEEGDTPLKEHEKHFPECPFIQGSMTPNVPLLPPDEDEQELVQFLNDYLQYSLQNRPPSLPANRMQTDAVSLARGTSTAFPAFSVRSNRFCSFKNVAEMDIPPVEKMVQAGFFYTGTSDYVICYKCGGGLINWTKTDDPSEDHRLYYSHCPLVSQKDKATGAHPWSERHLSEAEQAALLKYSFSKKMVQLGLSPGSTKKALKQFLEKNHYLPQTLENCLYVVLEWDPNQGAIFNQMSKVIEEEQASGKNSFPEVSNHCHDTANEGSCLEMLLREKLKYMCRKCKTNEVAAIALPCRHFHFCKPCIAHLDICLSCGKQVLAIIYPLITE